MAYEMYLLCRKQQELGVECPLAFGLYFAGPRFLMFAMEVHNGKYIPRHIQQYSLKTGFSDLTT